MNVATNCHRSAVLCLRGRMTRGAGTIGSRRSDTTSCSSNTRGGDSFLGGRADHSSVSEVRNAWVLPPLPYASFFFGTVRD